MQNLAFKQKLKSQFYSRFYQWAVADAYREAGDDFPFLDTMHHIHVAPSVHLLRSFPRTQQTELLAALTKVSFQTSGEFSQVNLTAHELVLLQNYQQALDSFPAYRRQMYQAYYVEKRFFRIAIAKLKKLLLAEVDPMLGAIFTEKDYLNYRRIIGTRWHVSTAISLDSTGISYSHLLSILPQSSSLSNQERYQQRLVFSNSISLPSWLGFRDGSWIFFSEEDPSIAAKTVALACSHFLKALPDLLININLDNEHAEP
jgi:hypothetical protein